MDLYDKTGNNKIEPDCYIVYATSLGRSPGLKFGKVLEVETIDVPWGYHRRGDWYTDGTAGKEIKISVISVDDNWQHKEPSKVGKGILRFPERIIVISFSMLPMYAREILADA